ncbi:ABC transporter permease subunit [Enterocloster sp.]|uniref:ABC transporter permease subunit n=1 Tax=Enterocloster sp. TaxID=2719315 RepID=UPI0039A2890C
MTYLSILAVVFTFYLLKRTALGYHIRAVGEKETADSVGISVVRTQAIALVISGVMSDWAGPS